VKTQTKKKKPAYTNVLEYGLIFLPAWLWRLLRRGPLPTAIPRVSAGGLKPEIVARVWETRPGCYRAIVVKDSCQGQPGPARSYSASKYPGSLPRHCNDFHLAVRRGRSAAQFDLTGTVRMAP